ncbi:MAG: hypothetical protein OEW00_09370 [candidate division Zixibacteria bacterium]|nr:hypothetical protein [candidate division Zixibacteria bacterium]
MTDRTRQRLVYSALVLAILFAVYSFWPSKTQKTAPVAHRVSPSAVQESPVSDSAEISLMDIDARERLPWGQNPFLRRHVSPVTASEYTPWVLSGIIYNEREPMAIINKRTLRMGDIINRARVTKINRGTVVLEYDGNEFTLQVRKG